VCVCVCVCVCVRAYVCVCMYVYTHIHTGVSRKEALDEPYKVCIFSKSPPNGFTQ
jgi:hypothetical protein